MSTKTKAHPAGERLPYLLGKLKAPRVLERLEQTAATARAEGWAYEQFLETLLEAEVFASDASGSRNRIRHAAFPAHKNPGELRLQSAARRREAADPAPRPARLDTGTKGHRHRAGCLTQHQLS
jgi:DNA replication protein DnaC